MGVIKNDVGRPSNKTIMVRKILKLILVLIVIGLAVTLGYFIKDNEETKLNNRNDETTEVRKDISNEEAEKIIENIFGKKYKGDMQYLGYYNDDTNIFNKDFYKTLVAIRNTKTTNKFNCKDVYNNAIKTEDNGYIVFINNVDYYCNDVYSYDDVKVNFDKMFQNGNLLKENMRYLAFDEKINYSKKNDVYTILKDSNGDINYFVAGVYSAYEVKNKLYITIAFNHFEYQETDDDGMASLLLNDGTYVNDYVLNFEKISSWYGILDNKLIEEYGNHMENYELEFEKNNGDYIFIESRKK